MCLDALGEVRCQVRGPLGTGFGVLCWEKGLPLQLCLPGIYQSGAWLFGEAAFSLDESKGEGPLHLPLGSRVKADGLSLNRSEVLPESRRPGWLAPQEGGHRQHCLPACFPTAP